MTRLPPNYLRFPRHARPTPHQIFHLSPTASHSDIKARYYDLVRIHHPDSHQARSLTPSLRHARFQAITAAYESLTAIPNRTRPIPNAESVHRYSTPPRHHPPHPGPSELTDSIIIAIGLVTVIVAFAPFIYISPTAIAEQRHRAAVRNLADARRDAREMGEERMRNIRDRVRADRRDARSAPAHPASPPRET